MKRSGKHAPASHTGATDKTSGRKIAGKQGKPIYKTGSTTQGGSNFGQGSMELGPDSYKQGSVKNKGANYKNEAGKLSDTDETSG
jgi:hypothetical protein